MSTREAIISCLSTSILITIFTSRGSRISTWNIILTTKQTKLSVGCRVFCQTWRLTWYLSNSLNYFSTFSKTNLNCKIWCAKANVIFQFCSNFTGDSWDVRLELVRQLKSKKFCATAIKPNFHTWLSSTNLKYKLSWTKYYSKLIHGPNYVQIMLCLTKFSPV